MKDAIKIKISKNDTILKNKDYIDFLKKLDPDCIICLSEYP